MNQTQPKPLVGNKSENKQRQFNTKDELVVVKDQQRRKRTS